MRSGYLRAVLALVLGLAGGVASAEEPRTGDIVLLGNDSAWGFVARRFADEDARWSHAGMVIRDGKGIAVVHMDGSPTGGRIRREPVAAFTGQARYVRVVRPALDAGKRARVGEWLEGQLRRGTPFDTSFRLDHRPDMYCSELVWRALEHVSMTPGSDSLPSVAGRDYVPVDRLATLGRVLEEASLLSPPVAGAR